VICRECGFDWDRQPRDICADVRTVATWPARLERLDADAWSRVAIGSDAGARTVLDLARRAAHEAHHHALDIRRVLESADAT
jgi:hypothetical protein